MSENRTSEGLRKLWEQTSIPARAAAFMMFVLLSIVLVGVGWWALKPQYVPLANNLTPQQSAEIVSLLDGEGIANKRNFSGSGVLVDQTKWNQANSLVSSIADPNQMSSSSMGSSLLDPTTKDHRMNRDLENRLEKAISQLENVNTATVLLGIPEREVFARYQGQKTASITVQLRSGVSLSRRLSSTIVSTVANSVEGLSREHISVSDTNGNTHTFDDDSISGVVAGQLEYQRRLEEDLVMKAETMLEASLGSGKAVIRVSANIDFTKTETIDKIYDPESKVIDTEDTTSASGAGNDPLVSGAAGTASNLGVLQASNAGQDVTLTTETRKVTFLNGEKVETKTTQPGIIRRLTIAAMVDLSTDESVEESGTAAATAPALTADQVEEIIKSAVGFDASRQDEINVVQVSNLAGPLALEAEPEEEAPGGMDALMPIILKGVLCFAAIVAMMMGWLVMRKSAPIELVNDDAGTMNPERARQLSDLTSLARKNPELFANILSAWTGQGDQTGGSTGKGSGSKAA